MNIHTGGGDVTGSALRAEPLDRSAVSDKAATTSLEDQLELAERRLLSAQMIDNFQRMVRESDAAQATVDAIKRRIAERDRAAHADIERDYLSAAVHGLGDRHAG